MIVRINDIFTRLFRFFLCSFVCYEIFCREYNIMVYNNIVMKLSLVTNEMIRNREHLMVKTLIKGFKQASNRKKMVI